MCIKIHKINLNCLGVNTQVKMISKKNIVLKVKIVVIGGKEIFLMEGISFLMEFFLMEEVRTGLLEVLYSRVSKLMTVLLSHGIEVLLIVPFDPT